MTNEEQAEGVITPTEGEPTLQESPPEQQAPVENVSDESPASDTSPQEPTAEPLQAEAEKKPTRAEKRVHQLLDKLRERGAEQPATPQYQGSNDQPFANAPWNNTNESLWQPGAELTPQEIEAELNRRAASIAELQTRRILQDHERAQTYRQTVTSYTSDLEQISQAAEFTDKGFEKAFIKLYEKLNFENGQFVPRATPSEIYQDLKDAREAGQMAGAKKTSATIAQQAANQAIAPSVGSTDRESSELDAIRAEALTTGSTEAWAAYLKRRSPMK